MGPLYQSPMDEAVVEPWSHNFRSCSRLPPRAAPLTGAFRQKLDDSLRRLLLLLRLVKRHGSHSFAIAPAGTVDYCHCLYRRTRVCRSNEGHIFVLYRLSLPRYRVLLSNIFVLVVSSCASRTPSCPSTRLWQLTSLSRLAEPCTPRAYPRR